MSKKKQIVILSCMIALLAVTAVFNFVLTNNTTTSQVNASSQSANYFAGYRSERVSSRNEELLQLDSIISASKIDSEEYKNAISMKIELTKNTENELLLENLIKAYGFEDAVVVMGLDSDNVNVIVKSENLTTEDAISIYSILNEEVNITPENVKIIPIS